MTGKAGSTRYSWSRTFKGAYCAPTSYSTTQVPGIRKGTKIANPDGQGLGTLLQDREARSQTWCWPRDRLASVAGVNKNNNSSRA